MSLGMELSHGTGLGSSSVWLLKYEDEDVNG